MIISNSSQTVLKPVSRPFSNRFRTDHSIQDDSINQHDVRSHKRDPGQDPEEQGPQDEEEGKTEQDQKKQSRKEHHQSRLRSNQDDI